MYDSKAAPIPLRKCNKLEAHGEHQWRWERDDIPGEAGALSVYTWVTCEGRRAIGNVPSQTIPESMRPMTDNEWADAQALAKRSHSDNVEVGQRSYDKVISDMAKFGDAPTSVAALKEYTRMNPKEYLDFLTYRAEKSKAVCAEAEAKDDISIGDTQAFQAILPAGYPYEGTDLGHILTTLMPDMAEQLIRAGKHYGYTNHQKLGIKAQAVDIWRKTDPLMRALWYGEELTRETPRQIAMDLIGHLFLTIAMMDRDSDEDGR